MTPKEVAILAAQTAGKLVRESLGTITPDDIQDKRPFDYVTAVDKACEKLIIDLIRQHYPDHEILAEESGNSSQKNSFRWIIDPLDGTTNFIHHFPHSGVSIALEKEAEVILGVVYDPYRDELFWAEKGGGAYCNGKRIAVSKHARLSHCLIATGFPFKEKQLIDRYWSVLSAIFMAVSGIRRTGSAALDLTYVACGRFDGFFELRLSLWDIAAASIIVREAGGKITDFEGHENRLLSGSIIATNGLIHQFMLAEVQKIFPTNP
ncbi:MAG: inositol monophosphatase [candidate division KSB1 bacterium]|nr:inositol monophosphatase [candidate division KSB1 bacterium]MDZ7318397.1 inositol monophosphatase [candidate division KSB1 bacterium]MDZ7340071.1 inositol monophosphatase [candidate division KSB1 bacterium]